MTGEIRSLVISPQLAKGSDSASSRRLPAFTGPLALLLGIG